MKTKITIFITATVLLLLYANAAFTQSPRAYFGNRSGVTVFDTAISDIDSIVFKRGTSTYAPLYIMDETTVNETLQSIDDDGKMIFSNMPDDKKPAAGSIIVSSITDKTPYGFFYKVKSVTQNGNLTIVETEEASLEDAIEDADISEIFDLDDDVIGIFDENDNPLLSTRSTQGSNTISISKSFKDGDGTITVSGSLTISNELIFDYLIQKRDVKHLKMAYKVGCDFKASIVGEIKGNVSLWDIEIARIKFKPKVIMIGYFPLVLNPVIPIILKGDLNGGIKGDIKLFDSKNSLTLGVEYYNSELHTINETSDKTTGPFVGSNVSVSGKLKVSVEPEISVLLYNSKNVNFGAKVVANTSLGLSQSLNDLMIWDRFKLNPDLSLGLAFDAVIKAQLKILKKNLGQVELKVPLFEMDIFKVKVFPQFSDIGYQYENVNNMKVTGTATSQMPQFMFPVSQLGFCISENKEPSEKDPHISIGPMTGSTASMSATFPDLDVNKTYNIFPYFENWFGTFYDKMEEEDVDLANTTWRIESPLFNFFGMTFYMKVNFKADNTFSYSVVLDDEYEEGAVSGTWSLKDNDVTFSFTTIDDDGYWYETEKYDFTGNMTSSTTMSGNLKCVYTVYIGGKLDETETENSTFIGTKISSSSSAPEFKMLEASGNDIKSLLRRRSYR